MILQLLQEATVANGKLGLALPAASDTDQIKQFQQPGLTAEVKLRAAGPNSSSAWQRTILLVSTGRASLDLVATVVLTNANWQAAPQTILDPSALWAALSPGNGTYNIGGQSVTISGDTEIDATGATNGITGVNCNLERL